MCCKAIADALLMTLLEAHLSLLEAMYKRFNAVHNDIIGCIDDDQFTEQDKIRQAGDKTLLLCKMKCE